MNTSGSRATRVAGMVAVALCTVATLAACVGGPAPDDGIPETHVGIWGSSEEGAAFVEFAVDGSVAGFDGCAELDGNWSEYGDGQVATDALGTSNAECDASEAWLGKTAFVLVDGGRLVVLDAEGAELGRLDRAS